MRYDGTQRLGEGAILGGRWEVEGDLIVIEVTRNDKLRVASMTRPNRRSQVYVRHSGALIGRPILQTGETPA